MGKQYRYRFGDKLCEIELHAQPYGVGEASYSATMFEVQNDSRVLLASDMTSSTETGAVNRALDWAERRYGCAGEEV